MRSPWQGKVLGVWYDNHPHWVVDYGRYSVTLRCRGSLPDIVCRQLREIGETLRDSDPSSSQAETLRRRHFAILDHTLDSGEGPLPFTGATAAHLHEWIRDYAEDGLRFAHWVIMPNHWHLLTEPLAVETINDSKTIWRRFKARAARLVNQRISSSGPLWQTSHYDRWIRDEVEFRRWINYLRNNPVKARLAPTPEAYPYLQ